MLRSKIHIKRKGAFFSIFAVVLFALVGLTIALISDNNYFANLFHAGAYQAEYKEEFTSPSDWTPCEEVPKLVNVKNNSPVNLKVRLTYDEFWRNKANTSNLPLEKDGTQLAVINFQNEDDWEQRGEWYYYKEDLEPGESTSSLFESVTLDCHANLTVNMVCYDTPEGRVCAEPDDDDAYDKYHLVVTVQTSDVDFPREDEHYTVTINPNGGEYNGSSNVYSESLQFGTVIDLTSISYTDHELVNWTKNGSDSYVGDTIRVTGPLTLKANWRSSIFHTISLDLAGGELGGETAIPDTQVRREEYYTLTDTEPTREGYLFDGWELSDGSMLTEHTWQVLSDETITAKWSLIVAQNGRTSKFYRSITAAEAEAQNGDTVSLVTDADEQFTNTKNIILNLNALKLNGSITNNGTLTLLNGEVENDNGVAVINNGTLTMGVDDFIDAETVNIENNYVRIKGTTAGMEQNGTFNYYDGYIEGEIALDGGYDDSPFYRRAFDDEEVHYFPFVDKSPDDDELQRVILENSDLAVSKTTVGGDIYYYSLQNNINTSARTGYKIYIVREGWSTGEPITVPENTEITIDIEGHTFTATDTITINGKLTIEDSLTTIETLSEQDNSNAMISVNGNVFSTPHSDNTTSIVSYAGNIWTPQTTVINGELIVEKTKITGNSSNDTVQNNGTLTMQDGAIGAAIGYVLHTTETGTFALNANSYLFSSSSNNPAVYNSINNYEWNAGGNIYGSYYGFTNSSSSGLSITNGTIYGKRVGIYGNTSAAITLNGGIVESQRTGISGKTVVNDGKILVVNKTDTSTTISGIITTTQATVNGGEIIVLTTNNCETNGIYTNGSDGAKAYINGGTITASSTNGPAYGLQSGWSRTEFVITGGTISGSSVSKTSYGIYGYISVTSATANYRRTVTGGKITGGTYGIYLADSLRLVIGDNSNAVSITSPEIIGGQYAIYGGDSSSAQFYDGVLRGGVKAYRENMITATPDATYLYIEASEDYLENCWPKTADNYLQVGGGLFNSFAAAYAAITGDTGTIKVYDDATIESAHIGSPTGKNITFDLNGHKLTLAQPIINNSNMAVVDSDPGKAGRLYNSNPSGTAFTNNGQLTIESGLLSSVNTVVTNTSGSTLNIDGGTIVCSKACISSSGTNANPVTINITGGTIQNATSTDSSVTGLSSNSYTNISFTGGIIDFETSGTAFGIDGGSTTIETDPNATAISVKGSIARGASGTITLNSGKVTANATRYGFALSGTVTMNGGYAIISSTGTSTSERVSGITTTTRATVNGGTITASSTGNETNGIYTNGSDGAKAYINGGTITASSTNGPAYGLQSGWSRTEFVITGGTISGSSVSKTSYGIYGYISVTSATANYRRTVTGGKITGGTYGIYLADSLRLVIGDNSNAVSITSPEIIGGQYAIYGGDSSSAQFYDGVLRGGVKAYRDGLVTAIAGNYALHFETQTIDDSDYEVCYLSPEQYVAQIGTDDKYTMLSDAISNAEPGDVIEIINDAAIFGTLTISSEKEFTIETNNYDIIFGGVIVNNGNVSIINNLSNTTSFDYNMSKYLITNNAGATLSLTNIAIKSPYGIDNKGNATISNITIASANTALNNTGSATIGSSSMTSPTYALYNDGGTLEATGAVIAKGQIYNNAGQISLSNSSATKSGENINNIFTNKDKMALSKVDASLVNTNYNASGTTYIHTIYNIGNLTIADDSNINNAMNASNAFKYNQALYNDGGTATIADSSLTTDDALDTTTGSAAYGIYSPTGSLSLKSGSISVKKGRGATYGIYTETGTIVLGTPEPETSPGYGRETADVSQSEPEIKAVGSTGYGIKNASGGRVEYYDGKVSGNTAAFAEEPTITEHYYEVCTELDTTVTPNLYTARLFWMRDGQSSCGN